MNTYFNCMYADTPSLFEAFTLKVVPFASEGSTSTCVLLIEMSWAKSRERGESESELVISYFVIGQ